MPFRSYRLLKRAATALVLGALCVLPFASSASAAGYDYNSGYGSSYSGYQSPWGSSNSNAYQSPWGSSNSNAYQSPWSSSCSGYSCYGQPSEANGLPRTNYVSGYTRSDGTYVNPYFRSR